MKKKKSEVIGEEMEQIRARLMELDEIEEPTEEQAEQARSEAERFEELAEQRRAAAEEEERMERIRSYAIDHPEVRQPGGPEVKVSRNRTPYDNLDQVRAGFVGLDDMVSRARYAIEDDPSATFTDAQRQRALELSENPAIARHILLHGSPEYRAAFQSWLRDPIGYRGTALSTTDANGGYLTVPYQLDPTIILTNTGSDNPFRQIATVKTIAGTDTWNGVTSAGVTAEWLAEATEAAEAGPTMGSVTIPVHKAFAEITASYEILADSNFGAQLPTLLADAKDRLEEAAFATGSGSGQPTGLVTAVAAVTASRVSPTTAGTFTSTSQADVYKLINALPPRHRSRSSWIGNFSTYNIVRQMDSSGGSAFWANFAGPTQPERLLGLPVYESSTMTATVTTGSNILLAGNMAEYAIVDRVGMSVMYDPHVRGSNARHTGQGQYSAFWRVGANVTTATAFRVLQL